MLQTWNSKMDFRKDLLADVKAKEETFDVSCLINMWTDELMPDRNSSIM
jgi:hypothetical protein